MIDKRTFLYLTLGLLGYMLWSQWQVEHAPPVEKTQVAQAQTKTVADLPPTAVIANQQAQTPVQAASSAEVATQSKIIKVNSDVLKLEIDTKGGNIIQASLPKYPVSVKERDIPVTILSSAPENFYISQSGLVGPAGPDTKDGQVTYQVDKDSYEMTSGEQALTVDLKWQNNAGVSVVKRYTLKRGQYDVNVEYLIANNSTSNWQGNFYAQIQRKKEADGGFLGMNTYQGAAISSEKIPYEKITYKDMEKANLDRKIEGGWVSMQQQYFISAWVPDAKQLNDYFSAHDKNSKTNVFKIGYVGPELTVAPGAKASTASKFYVGPELQEDLNKLSPYLGKTIDYGWLFILSQPIYWLLSMIYHVVGNWGWAIVLITILIKLAFYKLAESSYRSMAKMRDLQPRLLALKERYADDKQKQSQAMMELYRNEKVNPLGGCLPMVIQMPFFIALYYVLIESVELRQAPFIFWIQDLSVRDPLYILPGLMMIAMLLQTRLSPTPPDRAQAIMMYVMPLAFSAFFATFPAGLVLYWFVNILFSIAQQWFIMNKYGHKKTVAVKAS